MDLLFNSLSGIYSLMRFLLITLLQLNCSFVRQGEFDTIPLSVFCCLYPFFILSPFPKKCCSWQKIMKLWAQLMSLCFLMTFCDLPFLKWCKQYVIWSIIVLDLGYSEAVTMEVNEVRFLERLKMEM